MAEQKIDPLTAVAKDTSTVVTAKLNVPGFKAFTELPLADQDRIDQHMSQMRYGKEQARGSLEDYEQLRAGTLKSLEVNNSLNPDFSLSPEGIKVFAQLTEKPEHLETIHDAINANLKLETKKIGPATAAAGEPVKSAASETPAAKSSAATTESTAEKTVAKESAAKAGADSERKWVEKLFKNAEGEIHGGKVAAWVAGTAAAGAGIYALTHNQKEEDRRESSSAPNRNAR